MKVSPRSPITQEAMRAFREHHSCIDPQRPHFNLHNLMLDAGNAMARDRVYRVFARLWDPWRPGGAAAVLLKLPQLKVAQRAPRRAFEVLNLFRKEDEQKRGRALLELGALLECQTESEECVFE